MVVARPRKHDTDVILDAARDLVLKDGPRAASVAAIAVASGAPVGTLYHRFSSRDGLLTAAWLRALERFQVTALRAAHRHEDPIERGAALARASIDFAQQCPDDARLLIVVRRDDLLDATSGQELHRRLAEINEPLRAEIRAIVLALFGKADARSAAAVVRAIVDLPYGVVRRYATTPKLPRWLAADVAADARLLLSQGRE
jgi:AcrR family transcriptional regulator